MHRTKNDLPEKVRTQVVALLQERLADCIDLEAQSKHAHWNVKGPSFIALHELFDKVAENVEEHIDTLAERVTALGGTARGTLAAVARATSLRPYPDDIKEGIAHVAAPSAALADYGAKLRAGIQAAARPAEAD